MDESWEDSEAGYGDEVGGSAVLYRSQREADAIFARLRSWRERGRAV